MRWLSALLAVGTLVLTGCGDVTGSSSGPTGATAGPSSTGVLSISGYPATTASAGTPYAFQPSAVDTDGDTLTFAIQNQPAWARFNPATGLLAGTPAAADVGTTAPISITVSDGHGTVALQPFQIEISTAAGQPASPPTLSGTPPGTVQVGAHYIFQPGVAGSTAANLVFSIANKPNWAAFNTATGQLSGTPGQGDVGTDTNIIISASDGQVSSSLPPFSIQVISPPNPPPTIGGSPPTTAAVGANYHFQPSASDPDGDVLVFSITNKPAWASFDSSSGVLSGIPGSGDVGTTSGIVISVGDGHATVTLPPFSITVTATPAPTNTPPVISGVPPTAVQAGSTYTFQPSASDADGDTLTFMIANRPAWAWLNASTGRLSGTPPSTATGTYAGIVISVSDGHVSTALPAFSITVSSPPNQPPSISGTPQAQVQAGSAYAFTPTAKDPDGDSLTFSIQNRPAWATFSTTTGALTGTPTTANAGIYANIVISVSDGKISTPLPGFSITVTSPPVVLGTANLTWTAPRSNTDGTPLTDLAGYEIRYGTSSGNLSQRIQIPDPTASAYTVAQLGAGTWYFAISAYTTTGQASALSNVGSKTIQ